MNDHDHNEPPRGGPKPDESWSRILEERESTDRIFECMREGIILHTSDGVIKRINRSMERILGKDCGDAEGRTVSELLGDDISGLCVQPGRVPEAGESPGVFTVEGREYEVVCTPVIGLGPGAGMAVTVLHDVTEKREMDKKRSEILSMVSHDVKAPLSTIMGYCELILDGSLGKVSDDVKEGVSAMMRSGRKILGIVEDFIIASSTEAGVITPSFSEADLVPLCRELVDVISPEVSRVDRKLLFSPEGEIPRIRCDSRLIERVISNLLDNAIKYSNIRGTIELKLKTTQEGKVEILVVDDGIGIAPDELPHVFDRYWRGSRVGKIKGSGLGLSIVKRIVEMHGGEIGIESEKGVGTQVRILLPGDLP